MALRAEKGDEMGREIERKFLVNRRPDGFEEILHGESHVWYISTEPEKRLWFGMFSDGSVEYRYTEKGNGLLNREENEKVITEEEFKRILSDNEHIQDAYIHNRFWDYKCNNHVLEYTERDVDRPTAFATLEVEFENEQDATCYALPENIDGVDVTLIDSYKMKNYWKRTRLKLVEDN